MRSAVIIVSMLVFGIAGCEREPEALAPRASDGSSTGPSPEGEKAPEGPEALGSSSGGEVVTVAGRTFEIPQGWIQVPPANPMRLAELHAPESTGEESRKCVAVFSTAGGDVRSNIARWEGQVRGADGRPATAEHQTHTVGQTTVHLVGLTGTYSGMAEAPKPDWTVRGAIIELPGTLLFIKMTGPADAMAAAAPAFDEMVLGMRAD